MKKLFFVLSFWFFISSLYSKEKDNSIFFISLVNRNYSYLIPYKIDWEKCQFLSQNTIKVIKILDNKKEELFFLEEVFLSLKIEKKEDQNIDFFLGTLKNIKFHASLEKKEEKCFLKKFFTFKERKREYTEVKIKVTAPLWVDALEYAEFWNHSQLEEKIFYWDLEGLIFLYEVKLGFLFNFHSQWRKQDERPLQQLSSNIGLDATPILFFQLGPLFLNQDGFGVVLLPLKNITYLTVLLLEGEPYKHTGIRSREKSLYWGHLIKFYGLELLHYREILKKHEGSVFKVTYDFEFLVAHNIWIHARPSYQYWNTKYMKYHFETTEQESKIFDLPSYEINKGTFNWSLVSYMLYRHEEIDYLFGLAFKEFGEGVHRSPLVDQTFDFQVFTGMTYKIF